MKVYYSVTFAGQEDKKSTVRFRNDFSRVFECILIPIRRILSSGLLARITNMYLLLCNVQCMDNLSFILVTADGECGFICSVSGDWTVDSGQCSAVCV